MHIETNMKLFLVFCIANICLAAELKCPTCFSTGLECKLVEEIPCSEHTVKPISDFCPGFDDRAMWGSDFICLNVYDWTYYKRFQGCFHRFNDQLDMCSVLKKGCPHMFDCTNSTNGQVSDQWNSIKEEAQPSAADSNSPADAKLRHVSNSTERELKSYAGPRIANKNIKDYDYTTVPSTSYGTTTSTPYRTTTTTPYRTTTSTPYRTTTSTPYRTTTTTPYRTTTSTPYRTTTSTPYRTTTTTPYRTTTSTPYRTTTSTPYRTTTTTPYRTTTSTPYRTTTSTPYRTTTRTPYTTTTRTPYTTTTRTPYTTTSSWTTSWTDPWTTPTQTTTWSPRTTNSSSQTTTWAPTTPNPSTTSPWKRIINYIYNIKDSNVTINNYN